MNWKDAIITVPTADGVVRLYDHRPAKSASARRADWRVSMKRWRAARDARRERLEARRQRADDRRQHVRDELSVPLALSQNEIRAYNERYWRQYPAERQTSPWRPVPFAAAGSDVLYNNGLGDTARLAKALRSHYSVPRGPYAGFDNSEEQAERVAELMPGADPDEDGRFTGRDAEGNRYELVPLEEGDGYQLWRGGGSRTSPKRWEETNTRRAPLPRAATELPRGAPMEPLGRIWDTARPVSDQAHCSALAAINAANKRAWSRR